MLIKACPFCGDDPELFVTSPRTVGHGESADDAGVRCTGCDVSIKFNNYAGYEVLERQIKAVEMWNKRV